MPRGQIAETHLQTSAELQNQSIAIQKELDNILQALQIPPAPGWEQGIFGKFRTVGPR